MHDEPSIASEAVLSPPRPTQRLTDLVRRLRVSALAGPIFEKELRVASRRRRSYFLRFLYVAVLACFVVANWQEVGAFQAGYGASVISRMSLVGRDLVATVAWFQFVTMQILAVVVMSAAVSEETQRRTLGVLMSTPITGWQFVIGKLLSKLFGLLVLLAISLPVLAVVRVYGGVPWSFVVSTLCITFASVVLIGSISLFLALGRRDTFWTIAWTVGVYGFLFVLLPHWINYNSREPVLSLWSPFIAMGTETAKLMGSTPGSVSAPHWGYFCLVAGTVSLAYLWGAARRVRAIGLRTLDPETRSGRRKRRKKGQKPAIALRGARQAIQRVSGSPLIWKELRFYLPGSRREAAVGIGIATAILATSYVLNFNEGGFERIQRIYVALYFGIGLIVTAALAGGAIAAERESRALGLLLSLPVSNNHIILAKALGVFYRALPAWLVLVGHTLVFSATGSVHPILLLHMVLLAVLVSVFITGMGLYYSTRMRTGSSAGAMTIATAVVLWSVVPAMAQFVPYWDRDSLAEVSLAANPAVQLMVVSNGAVMPPPRVGRADSPYHWPSGRTAGALRATTELLGVSLLYCCGGLLFALRARTRLRRCSLEDGG